MTLEEKLMQMCGAYTLPFLIHIYTKDNKVNLYYVNDNVSVKYKDNTYEPCAFEYTPNASSSGFDGGGKLTIEARGNTIIPIIDSYKNIFFEAVGGVLENGNVEPLSTHSHSYGTVSISNDGKAEFTFEKDARLNMKFPALIWNRQNNRGNS